MTSSAPTLTCFDLRIEDRVATLTMNRPDEFNTITPTAWREFEATIDWLQREAPARVLVLAGAGKHFCAGLALDTFGSEMAVDDADTARRANFATVVLDMQRALDKLAALRMPVIAAIHGACVGGGIDISAACDMRYCTADTFFCIQEINIGMAADLGTLQRLPKLIPDGVVREYAYSGRRMTPQRAFEVGLVNEVSPTREEMMATVRAIATEIASKPPIALWASKQAIDYARDHPVADSLKQMAWLQAGLWDAAAIGESVQARKDRRTPEYRDLAPLHYFQDGG